MLAVLSWDDGAREAVDASAAAHLARLVTDTDAARRTLLACSEAGAVDGITGAAGGSCDGMPLEAHLAVLDELRALALDGMCGEDGES